MIWNMCFWIFPWSQAFHILIRFMCLNTGSFLSSNNCGQQKAKMSRPYLWPWPAHGLTFTKQFKESGKPTIKIYILLLIHDLLKIRQSFLCFFNILKIFTYPCFISTSKHHPKIFTFAHIPLFFTYSKRMVATYK